ncbi:uncharacterized protein BO87DRAFT_23247 [Aspergillus neoniger CBS 115656]|uniref:Uncharacterized protein n=1 Tax=Aspergillus neoniger (strain CBS 115656) TaxID=1448310 RepID=A0A318YN64_ASPNB|nr:hypothetical protein BO87DRAFT_23247 [Aspergillus neoniger CBS 115656]PYH35769.1 hypothetical protein BO87DRAFT_23247 [Aspergillus neoniger CBS 115656]
MGRGSPDSERANIRESFQASGDRLDSSGRVALDYNAIVQPELIGRLAIVHPSVRTSVPLFIAWRLSSIPPGPYKSKGLNGPPRFSLVVVQYLLGCRLPPAFLFHTFVCTFSSSICTVDWSGAFLLACLLARFLLLSISIFIFPT